MKYVSGELKQVLERSECLYDFDAISDALDRIADEITAELKDSHPLALCVLNGGLIFAGHLLTRLSFPLQMDYIHATRYRGETSGSNLHWIARPHSSLEGRTILLLDDIFDQGFTLEEIVADCKAQGAKAVYSAVLLSKNHDRPKANMKPEFSALEVKDEYVFGFGMDYSHELRNLNGVYALKDA